MCVSFYFKILGILSVIASSISFNLMQEFRYLQFKPNAAVSSLVRETPLKVNINLKRGFHYDISTSTSISLTLVRYRTQTSARMCRMDNCLVLVPCFLDRVLTKRWRTMVTLVLRPQHVLSLGTNTRRRKHFALVVLILVLCVPLLPCADIVEET